MIQIPALQVVQPLRVLFTQDNFDMIPVITLKPNSDLSLITSNVASLAITSSPVADQKTQVESIFDAISEYLQDSRNILRLQTLEYTAKGFAATLENSYSTLNDIITPTVDEIKKDIDARYIELMVREKAESLISELDVVPSESDYTILNWGVLASPIRQTEVIDSACANANITNVGLSSANLGYVTRKSSFVSEFTDMKLPPEVSSTILDRLLAALVNDNSAMSDTTVKGAWNVFTNQAAYVSFCADAYNKFFDARNVAINCLNFIADTEGLLTVSGVVRQIAVDDLSPESIHTLSANIDTVGKTIYAIQYWLLYGMNVSLVDKLILTSTILNGPVYHEFVANGNNIVDIHNFLKAFHSNLTLPLIGIPMEKVTSSNVSEHLERAAAKLRSNASFVKSKCLIAAFELSVRKFIIAESTKSLFPNVAEPGFVAAFIATAMRKASYLSGDVANIDKVLYDLIVSVFYGNTLVSTLFEYLGKGFDNLADTSDDDITDQRIIQAQCSSVCELLIDHLLSNVTCDRSIIDSALEGVY